MQQNDRTRADGQVGPTTWTAADDLKRGFEAIIGQQVASAVILRVCALVASCLHQILAADACCLCTTFDA